MAMKRQVLFVPGLGSKGSGERDYIDCRVLIFDYMYTSKAIIDFFADNYLFITTERVKRLEKLILDLYSDSKSLYIIAHSHGALLVHNALKNIGKKYGRSFTEGIEVATFGPAKAIPICHKHYILKDATNIFFENDWILKRFENKRFGKFQKDVETIVKYNSTGCDIKVKVMAPSIWCSGTTLKEQAEAHRCYESLIDQSKMKKCV